MEVAVKAAGNCNDCGNALPKLGKGHTGGVGYGTFREGDGPEVKVCYDCCAVRERKDMEATGVATLYWARDGWVTNWPGTLRFRVREFSKGRHNMAGTVYYVYFKDKRGKPWRGKQVGENTQLLHCRRIKG